MNNKNILKLLIFLITASLGAVETYAYAEVEQSLRAVVQPAVSVVKNVSSSVESTSANSETGVISPLISVFDLLTNGYDADYDFIMYSRTMSGGSQVSAYGNNGSLLFGNIENEPTAADITDAKVDGNNNKNVIVYPVSVAITSPMSVTYRQGYGTYGDCYVIKVNNGMEGVVTHTVGPSPVSGTYQVGHDAAGTYQAVVTLTAISK